MAHGTGLCSRGHSKRSKSGSYQQPQLTHQWPVAQGWQWEPQRRCCHMSLPTPQGGTWKSSAICEEDKKVKVSRVRTHTWDPWPWKQKYSFALFFKGWISHTDSASAACNFPTYDIRSTVLKRKKKKTCPSIEISKKVLNTGRLWGEKCKT